MNKKTNNDNKNEIDVENKKESKKVIKNQKRKKNKRIENVKKRYWAIGMWIDRTWRRLLHENTKSAQWK